MILLQGTSNNVPRRVFEKSLVKHLQLGVVMLNTTETLCQKNVYLQTLQGSFREATL